MTGVLAHQMRLGLAHHLRATFYILLGRLPFEPRADGAVRAMRGAIMPRRASPGPVVGEDLTKPHITRSALALQAWAVPNTGGNG
jgi:hypothetical protein